MEEKVSVDMAGEYLKKGINFLLDILPSVVLGVVGLVIGLWLIKKMMKVVNLALGKSGFSKEIGSFLTSIISIILKVFLFLSVAGIVGIDTAAFIGVLAAASFAVGMALQGSLSNFAAGIIILVFKPYKVGDWVEVQDKFGKVEDIQIFNTIVNTPGQKVLIIPNGEVISGIVTNYSKKGFIRMELNVTMPYEESFPKVKEIIMIELLTINKVLKKPQPEIGIENFESHNIVLAVRPYAEPDDYWEVYYEAYEKIKAAFSSNQIRVAYSEGVEIGKIGE